MNNSSITEIYKGHYKTMLDYPTAQLLSAIIDVNYKYVWGINHNENKTDWKKYDYNLFNYNLKDKMTFVRNIKLEFLMETKDFIELIPNINQEIHIIQINRKPLYYLNLENIYGKKNMNYLKIN